MTGLSMAEFDGRIVMSTPPRGAPYRRREIARAGLGQALGSPGEAITESREGISAAEVIDMLAQYGYTLGPEPVSPDEQVTTIGTGELERSQEVEGTAYVPDLPVAEYWPEDDVVPDSWTRTEPSTAAEPDYVLTDAELAAQAAAEAAAAEAAAAEAAAAEAAAAEAAAQAAAQEEAAQAAAAEAAAAEAAAAQAAADQAAAEAAAAQAAADQATGAEAAAAQAAADQAAAEAAAAQAAAETATAEAAQAAAEEAAAAEAAAAPPPSGERSMLPIIVLIGLGLLVLGK